MNGNKHKIQQQCVEVHFEGLTETVGIQNEIAEMVNEALLPGLETLFDEFAGEKYSISIDSMEIDCGTLPVKNWKRELVDETLRKVKHELAQAIKKEIKQAQTYDLAASFLFFIETGCLPWNSSITHVEELEKAELTGGVIEKLTALLNDDSQVAERLINSFSAMFFKALLNALTKNKIEELGKIYFLLTKYKLSISFKIDVKVLLLRAFSANADSSLQLFFSYLYHEGGMRQKQLIDEIVAKEKLPPIVPELKIKSKTNSNEPGHVYVNNAGLVILHPFLQILFEKLGLVKEGKWKNTASQHKAVYISQFLVTGTDRQPEFDLPLNKVLCGLNIADVLKPSKKLSAAIKKECSGLLDVVIANWSVLKNTSREALRETFLQRNGKLTTIDKGWSLNVEHKGFDVLLNSLPWGIGVIKLPWMEKMVFVEWV